MLTSTLKLAEYQFWIHMNPVLVYHMFKVYPGTSQNNKYLKI